MHIVVLYQHYLGPGDPGFSRLNEYALKWTAEGYEVSVIASQVNYMTGKKDATRRGFLVNRTVDINGVKVIRAYIPATYQNSTLQKIIALGIFALSSVMATLFVNRPSVVLVSSPPLFMALPGLFMKLFRRVPYVFDVRDLWPESGYSLGVLRRGSLFARILAWLEKLAVNKACSINVLTPAFKDDLIRREMVHSDKIKVIPNGVDLNKLSLCESSGGIRRQLGWEGRFVVLYTGAHGLANHLQQLIDAAEILQDIPEVLIACVGDGMSLPGLKRKVIKNGMKNIRFYGPFSREETSKIVSASDVCTAVLKRAGAFKKVYPNKLFEYMAYGKPIILGIDGAARELLEKARSGIYVAPEDPIAFAEAVGFLKQHPEIRKEMGLNGREYIAKYFNLDDLYAKMTSLLISVAKS